VAGWSVIWRVFGTVVAVTHDRVFLDNVAGWILDSTAARAFPGKATTRLGWTERSTGQGREAASARQKTLQRELEWDSPGPRARQARANPHQAYEEMGQEQFSRRESELEIQIPGQTLGWLVVEAKGISKGYRQAADRKPSFRLPPAASWRDWRQRVGKTTLFV